MALVTLSSTVLAATRPAAGRASALCRSPSVTGLPVCFSYSSFIFFIRILKPTIILQQVRAMAPRSLGHPLSNSRQGPS